jgi:hypothetical protein
MTIRKYKKLFIIKLLIVTIEFEIVKNIFYYIYMYYFLIFVIFIATFYYLEFLLLF